MVKSDSERQSTAPGRIVTWDLIPRDLKVYILERTNPSTLFSMWGLSRGSRDAVAHCLYNISASTLLRLLPISADVRLEEGELLGSSVIENKGYRNARLEVSRFQQLARILNLGSRWKQFKTLEEGVLALMTVPLNQLNAEDVKCMTMDGIPKLPSEFVLAERMKLEKRFGIERVETIIKKINRGHDNTEGKQAPLIEEDYYNKFTVLAMMVLRISDNTALQDFFADVAINLCKDDILDSLQDLLSHAQDMKNERLLEIFEWLTDSKGDAVRRYLDYIDSLNPAGNYASEKMVSIDIISSNCYSLLAQPGCLDRPIPLIKMSSECFTALNAKCSNDVLWCLALIYNSWQLALDLHSTMRAQAQYQAIEKLNPPDFLDRERSITGLSFSKN